MALCTFVLILSTTYSVRRTRESNVFTGVCHSVDPLPHREEPGKKYWSGRRVPQWLGVGLRESPRMRKRVCLWMLMLMLIRFPTGLGNQFLQWSKHCQNRIKLPQYEPHFRNIEWWLYPNSGTGRLRKDSAFFILDWHWRTLVPRWGRYPIIWRIFLGKLHESEKC